MKSRFEMCTNPWPSPPPLNQLWGFYFQVNEYEQACSKVSCYVMVVLNLYILFKFANVDKGLSYDRFTRSAFYFSLISAQIILKIKTYFINLKILYRKITSSSARPR